jgi:hypothetical protein
MYLSVGCECVLERVHELVLNKIKINKKRKLYIYQTIIQSILMNGAEVWQIPTREIKKKLSTEMDVLR